jgi:predicted nucleotidyltransferase
MRRQDIMPHLAMNERADMKNTLVRCLSAEPEVRKIIIFGSFLHVDDPADMDVAVFQDSKENYLPLAMKYRRLTRSIARKISLDIIPLKHSHVNGPLPEDLLHGEVVYER